MISGIQNAFQALALDEHRKPFTPTLWSLPESNTTTNLIQCWFPGVHVNVGGGSDDGLKKTPKGDLETMANTTFAWMVDRCRPFLHFEEKSLNWISTQYFEALDRLMGRVAATQKTGWGIGPYQQSFKGIIGVVGGEEIRTPGHYPNKPNSREYIHPVVFHAQLSQKYASKALEGFERVSKGEGKGHKWIKTYYAKDEQSWREWASSLVTRGNNIKKDAQSVTVSLDEFVIPRMVSQQSSFSNNRYYASPFERLLVLRYLWTPEQTQQAFESEEEYRARKNSIIEQQSASRYLMQLDKDNSATKELGPDVAWGTPVETGKTEREESDPFIPAQRH